jgi:hypothetical protein
MLQGYIEKDALCPQEILSLVEVVNKYTKICNLEWKVLSETALSKYIHMYMAVGLQKWRPIIFPNASLYYT